jgi:hypothetical protein
MTRAKLLDAVRRAGRTFVQAGAAYLALNSGHATTSKALAVGAVGAGLAAVWRLLDPAEPPTLLPLIEPQPTIQVHVAGTDPAKVADEVAKQIRQHARAAPVPLSSGSVFAPGGVVAGGHPDPLLDPATGRPVKATPPPPDPVKRSS